MNKIFVKIIKTFLGLIWDSLGPPELSDFFVKNWAPLLSLIYNSLIPSKKSEKTNEPFLRFKRTDWWTDKQIKFMKRFCEHMCPIIWSVKTLESRRYIRRLCTLYKIFNSELLKYFCYICYSILFLRINIIIMQDLKNQIETYCWRTDRFKFFI